MDDAGRVRVGDPEDEATEAITAARIWPKLSTMARPSTPRGLNSASAAKAAAAIKAIDTRIVKVRQSMPRRALRGSDPISLTLGVAGAFHAIERHGPRPLCRCVPGPLFFRR